MEDVRSDAAPGLKAYKSIRSETVHFLLTYLWHCLIFFYRSKWRKGKGREGMGMKNGLGREGKPENKGHGGQEIKESKGREE